MKAQEGGQALRRAEALVPAPVSESRRGPPNAPQKEEPRGEACQAGRLAAAARGLCRQAARPSFKEKLRGEKTCGGHEIFFRLAPGRVLAAGASRRRRRCLSPPTPRVRFRRATQARPDTGGVRGRRRRAARLRVVVRVGPF